MLIRQHVLETDIHPFVAGVSFEEVSRNRVEDRLGNEPAPFAGIEELIRMKEAAGRAKDFEDLKVLRQIKERRKG